MKLSGFGVFQVRSKRARMGRNPQDRRAGRHRAASGDRLSRLAGHEGPRRRGPWRLGRGAVIDQGAGRLSHHFRSLGRAGRAPACAALLGDPVLIHPADEAGRRTALLSAPRHRHPARRAPSAPRRRHVHQGRAATPSRRGCAPSGGRGRGRHCAAHGRGARANAHDADGGACRSAQAYCHDAPIGRATACIRNCVARGCA